MADFFIKAINTTGVTVTIAELQEDVEGATVEVTDPTGKTIAVVAQKLVKGTTEVTIPFAKALETVAPGVWTVDGKTFEVKSSDATFTNLTADVGTWNKNFEADVAGYELLVDDATTTVNFTPQAAEGSTITATYNPTGQDADKVTMVVQNGKANAVTLGEAATEDTGQTVTFTVIAPDQKSSKEYTVTIKKADVNANNDATLKTLTATELAGLNFEEAKTEYNVKVKEEVSSIKFDGTTNKLESTDTNAKIFVNGKEYAKDLTVDLAHGKNTIEIKVLAADNKTEKVYTVNVERAAKDASKDATLGSFTVSEGTLKDFKPGTPGTSNKTELTLDVANAVQELTIVPVASSPKAKVEVKADTTSGNNTDLKVVADGNGYKVTGLSADASKANKVTVTVTSEDATQKETYELTINRAAATASDIAQLDKGQSGSELNINKIADFKTDFEATKEEYNYNVAKTVEKLEFTNVKAAAGGKVEYKVNGDNWKEVAESKFDAPLKVGANTIQIKVLAADNKTERTYTIKVNRASENASDVATLSNILLSDNVQLEGFTADKKVVDGGVNSNITASIPSEVKDLTFTPQTTDANASVKVTAGDLKVVQKGGSFTVENLPAGQTTEVTITVTPESAKTDADIVQKYVVKVTKAAANANDNAFASAIVLGDKVDTPLTGFAKDKYEYTTSVPFATNATKLSVKPEDKTATVKVNGKTVALTGETATTADLPLAVGDNKFTIEVTSANGKVTKTYTVNVKRAAETASNNAGLTALTVDQGTLVVEGGLKAEVVGSTDNTSNATLKLASDVKDITFTATPAVEGAKVELLPTPTTGDNNKGKVTGMTVANVADGDSYDLVVTSPDTNVTYTTTITIEKASENASAIADLTALTVTPSDAEGTKAFKFDKDKTAFDYYVTNATKTIKVEATPTESVTYEFNGEAVTDVTALPLKVGKNEVKVTSLAADNKTSKEYTITVYRASSSDSTETELKSFKDLTNKVDAVVFGEGNKAEDVTVPAANDAFKFSLPTLPAGATAKVTATATTGEPATEVKVVESNGVYTTAGISAETTITIEVTAADKATVATYTINVTVAE